MFQAKLPLNREVTDVLITHSPAGNKPTAFDWLVFFADNIRSLDANSRPFRPRGILEKTSLAAILARLITGEHFARLPVFYLT
jgi:hypothetical protein